MFVGSEILPFAVFKRIRKLFLLQKVLTSSIHGFRSHYSSHCSCNLLFGVVRFSWHWLANFKWFFTPFQLILWFAFDLYVIHVIDVLTQNKENILDLVLTTSPYLISDIHVDALQNRSISTACDHIPISFSLKCLSYNANSNPKRTFPLFSKGVYCGMDEYLLSDNFDFYLMCTQILKFFGHFWNSLLMNPSAYSFQYPNPSSSPSLVGYSQIMPST